LATIRIYKVAEILDLPSQEVIELLKREHGIDLKSASSTIEVIVARQLADRLVKEKRIKSLPEHSFSRTSARKISAKKGRAAKQVATEPVKPTAPQLGPPRLIKSAKAAKQTANEEAETAAGNLASTEAVVAAPAPTAIDSTLASPPYAPPVETPIAPKVIP
jgi:translation initiation factor IF-2